MQINQQVCANCLYFILGKCEIHEHEITLAESFYEWCHDWQGEKREDDRLCGDTEGARV